MADKLMTGARPSILEAVGGTPIVKLNKLGAHLKAHIYEVAGRLPEALQTWRVAARVNASNAYARRQVSVLSAKLGKPVAEEELAPSYLLEQREAPSRPEAPTPSF